MKATDQEILLAYNQAGSVWKAAKLLGMCGQSVHERLVRLNAAKPVRYFTEPERERLQDEYQAHAAAGTLQMLADDMGRSKQFICRQAGKLGLTSKTRPKAYLRKYDQISVETARELFEKYKLSHKSLSAFAKGAGFGANGLSSLFHYHFEAEYTEFVDEKRNVKNWRYAAGRRFEYRVRDYLTSLGAFCICSPGSKTPVDILAILNGAPLFVQCKTGDWHSVQEWNEFLDLSRLYGATPIFATRKTGGELKLYLIDEYKDGSRRPVKLRVWGPEAKTVVTVEAI